MISVSLVFFFFLLVGRVEEMVTYTRPPAILLIIERYGGLLLGRFLEWERLHQTQIPCYVPFRYK